MAKLFDPILANWGQLAQQWGNVYSLSPAYLLATIYTESAGKENAAGDDNDSFGLCQFKVRTAQDVLSNHPYLASDVFPQLLDGVTRDSLFNPDINIALCAAHASDNLAKIISYGEKTGQGAYGLADMAHNAGSRYLDIGLEDLGPSHFGYTQLKRHFMVKPNQAPSNSVWNRIESKTFPRMKTFSAMMGLPWPPPLPDIGGGVQLGFLTPPYETIDGGGVPDVPFVPLETQEGPGMLLWGALALAGFLLLGKKR